MLGTTSSLSLFHPTTLSNIGSIQNLLPYLKGYLKKKPMIKQTRIPTDNSNNDPSPTCTVRDSNQRRKLRTINTTKKKQRGPLVHIHMYKTNDRQLDSVER